MPRALRPAPEEPEGTASLRILSSQREFASSARTRAKNRLRATLLEADPELATRREQLEELIAQNRAALAEHVANALAHAEELGRLTRRQERQAGTID